MSKLMIKSRIISLPSLLIILSCSQTAPRLEEKDRIDEAWNRNITIIIAALERHETQTPVDLRVFASAVKFLEDTTGIHSNCYTYIGCIPVPGMEETLGQWNAWYEENKTRLYIDEETDKIRVKKPNA